MLPSDVFDAMGDVFDEMADVLAELDGMALGSWACCVISSHHVLYTM